MDYNRTPKFGLRAINARGVRKCVDHRARQLEPRVEAGTPVLSGATKRSTHVETGHRSASGDRYAARIVQTGTGTADDPGAPVPTNFRSHRNYMIRALAGGA